MESQRPATLLTPVSRVTRLGSMRIPPNTDVVGRDGNGMLRHFLIPPSTEQKGGHESNVVGKAASRTRHARVDCHDREHDGEVPPPFQTLGRVAPERRVSPKRYGASPGVSCDTDLGEFEELD